jgi:hypothetical protein
VVRCGPDIGTASYDLRPEEKWSKVVERGQAWARVVKSGLDHVVVKCGPWSNEHRHGVLHVRAAPPVRSRSGQRSGQKEWSKGAAKRSGQPPKGQAGKTVRPAFDHSLASRGVVKRSGPKGVVQKEWSKRSGQKGVVQKEWSKRSGQKGVVKKEWSAPTAPGGVQGGSKEAGCGQSVVKAV